MLFKLQALGDSLRRIPPSLSLSKRNIRGALFSPPLQTLLAIFVHGTERASRNAHDNRIGRNVVDDQRSSSDDGIPPNSYVRENCRAQADDAVVFDHDGTENLQIRHLVAKYPNRPIMRCERHFRSNGDVIAYLNQVGFRPEV